jgi:diguanylate cyclase (GGDEF)-like protein/PAS domain S-box-containing protein
MEKHTPSLPVSSEDWDNTPPDVKRLVSSLLAKVALSENESYLIQFLDATPIGIAVHDVTGQLIYINNIGRSLLGTNRYSESETDRLSESFQIYRAGTQIPYPVKDLPSTRALAGETIQVSDLEVHRPDRIIPLEVTAIPVFDDQGQVTFAIATFQDISDRKQAEAGLAKSEQRFRNLFEATPNISVQGYNQQRQVIYWNDASEKLYGYTKTEAVGRKLEDLIIPPEMQQEVIAAVQNWIINGQTIPADELNLMRKDGSRVAVYSSHVMLQNFEGEQEIYCVDIDLRDREQTELALRESEERYRLLAENINDLVCLHDLDGRYLYVSPSCETLLGYRYDEMIGQDPYTFFHPNECDRIRQGAHKEVLSGKPTPTTYRMRQKSGNYIWFETLTKPIMDATGQVIQLQTTSRDVTERIQVQTKLKYDALHDALTGLPNRNLLMERLELAIHRAKRLENYHFAVLFLDLDRFKVINDSLGHLAGDQLLIAIAHKLQVTFREIDLVARLGGDEFVVLLEEVKDIQEAIHAVERLFSELKIPTIIEGRSVYTTSSIGIVIGSKNYDQASDLLRDADIAMYRAKAKGKARYELFDTEMHKQALNRMHLENDLRRAIDDQEFVLYYQPIVCLVTGYIVGFESLIRWQHPHHGLRYPIEFITIIEEIGLITSLSYWALKTACQQLVKWQTTFPNFADLKISVNLSAQDLQRSDLVEEIDHILTQTHLKATYLTLEITESMLIEDIESTIVILSQLKEKGIQISIDDFGTGYSSLSYLHRLPIDNLKVDRSFVNQMQEDKKNHRIVETISTLSEQLNLVAIAEGIETPQQLKHLQQLGYQFGQGYLFSKPLSQDLVEELLQNTNLYLFS